MNNTVKKLSQLNHHSLTVKLQSKVELTLSDPLSIRELQVLSLWLLGQTMSVIGSKLFISPRTVETHINHVRDKLQQRQRDKMVALLIHKGLYDELVFLAKELMLRGGGSYRQAV